jgi:hypothetical protein
MNTTTSHNLILPKYLIKVKEKGRKISKTCAREGGESVFISLFSFLEMVNQNAPFKRNGSLL